MILLSLKKIDIFSVDTIFYNRIMCINAYISTYFLTGNKNNNKKKTETNQEFFQKYSSEITISKNMSIC